jgi:hypothetical protein
MAKRNGKRKSLKMHYLGEYDLADQRAPTRRFGGRSRGVDKVVAVSGSS